MLALQVSTKLCMVLDNAVVHERYSIFLIMVRVRVLVGLATVRSPASVRNANRATVVVSELCPNLLDAVACAGAARGVLGGNELRAVCRECGNAGRV